MSQPPQRRRVVVVTLLIVVVLVTAMVTGLSLGPMNIPFGDIVGNVLSHLGLGHSVVSPTQSLVIWQIRAPRIILGSLVGAMLATAGATYQGVFRNPLADPYLLGVAAGAGLGATIAIVDLGGTTGIPTWTPWLAFAGAMLAVATTWTIGGRGRFASSTTLILAGVAVAALCTSAQTYLQQSSTVSIARVYIWLLGSLSGASWSSVTLLLPYVIVCAGVCVASARALDVLSVGDVEARALGLPVTQVRFVVIVASSFGTAAVVSVAGLIGFVGIIVPHMVRLAVGTSYRRVLPISLLGGAAFLVVADTVARVVMSPSELPLGVVTALVGAPVFVIILNSRRRFVS